MVEKKDMETEDDVPQLVKKWVEKNHAEFNEGGLQCGKHLYRENIFDRCEKYRSAPDEYLKTMLKTFPENIKWYFNIFQTVFIAGLFGLGATLLVLFLNNLSAWVKELSHTWDSITWGFLIGWTLPAVGLVVIGAGALMTNKKSRSPNLSNFIQTKFYIIQNLKELHIEMYYVSKILKIREANKKAD